MQNEIHSIREKNLKML